MVQGSSHIALIINPTSGSARRRKMRMHLIKHARRHLRTGKTQLGITLTRHPQHATELVAEEVARGTRLIIACGGDGTVNETATGLIDTPASLAIVPMGSGNGLARHLDVPLHWRHALDLALQGPLVTMDCGCIADRNFFATAGIGLDAEVGWAFATLNTRGLKSYIKATAQLYFHYKPRTYKLTIDGEPFECQALMLTFANGSQFGNNAVIAPRARVNDGMLDLVIVRPFPKMAIGVLATLLFQGYIDMSPHVETRRFRHIHATLPGPMRGHVDGEPIELPQELDISVRPGVLRTVAGPNAPEIAGLSPRALHPRYAVRRGAARLVRLVDPEHKSLGRRILNLFCRPATQKRGEGNKPLTPPR